MVFESALRYAYQKDCHLPRVDEGQKVVGLDPKIRAIIMFLALGAAVLQWRSFPNTLLRSKSQRQY
jgi:hypothetical protein